MPSACIPAGRPVWYAGHMALVGTVTRNNQGSKPFIARKADGTRLDQAKTARDAQKLVENARNLRLRWTRQDLTGSIEHYIGEDHL